MRLNIRQELILAPIVCLVVLLSTVAITYFGEQRLTALGATTRLLEQQRMDLQMLFRGINESLLTDGTPASVEIAREGIRSFESRYRQLSDMIDDPRLLATMEAEVGPRWVALRDATAPLLRINDVSNEDDRLLAGYGRLLVDGDVLVEKLQELAQLGAAQAQISTRRISIVVVSTVLLSLLGMLWLFWRLYRIIAVPLNELRNSMLEVSDGEGELLTRISRSRREPSSFDRHELRHEVAGLHHAFRFMLDTVSEHLSRHKAAELELQELNQRLEQGVEARTHELQVANQQMSAEIVHREQAQQALERARRDNARILEAAGEGIYGTDRLGRITFVNPAAAKMLGWEVDAMVGRNTHQLFHHSRPDRSPYPAEECKIRSVISSGERRRIDDEVFWRRDGSSFPVDYVASPVLEGGRRVGVVVVFRDISEKKRSDDRIYQLAHFDGLTNLPNRTLFKQHLEQAMFQTRRRSRGLAVLFLDLDRFKYINDTLGHPTGDRLLEVVARRLVDTLRPDDTVSRVGGDEFSILLRDVRNSEDVAKVAAKLLEEIARTVHLESHQLSVSASIGISLYPQDGADMETLQRNADVAMYHAKDQGKGTFQFFNSAMTRNTRERLELEHDLKHALENEEFRLVYQPQVAVSDEAVKGVEALLRWDRPGKDPVGPDRFIPVAEDCGVIIPIGDWVLRHACEQYRQWLDAGVAPERISVNLSARQLCDIGLGGKVRATLDACCVDPRCLELELTESSVMDNPEESIDILGELKSMGIRISVDDFGIAHLSLSYLKRLPIDRLKVDRSFIRDIPQDADCAAIAATVIAMARTLGLAVTAEGVETQEQLAFLRSRHCDEMQGFLFSRPLSAEQLGELLTRKGPAAATA